MSIVRIKGRQGVRRHGTAPDSTWALGTGVGQHRASARSDAGRRSALTLACLFALAGLFTAASAMGGQTHPFQSAFTGSDTPAGSLSTADKVAVRQSTGDVYVIDKGHGVVDTFDGSGTYVSQVGTFGFGGDPDLAVDNSATASEGNLIVLPERGPLSAYDPSGTLLYQLDGSTTPIGSFGDVCGTAADSDGNVYVADFSNQLIQKFDSSGTYLATIGLSFTPCDMAVDPDGTLYVIQWNTALHKLLPDGTDLGIIDSDSPRAVNVDPTNHHVYVSHDTSVTEYDASGGVVSTFGAGQVEGNRGVDVNGTSGQVYVSSNGSGGSKIIVFGPLVPVPDATTGDATNVAQTTATLNGHVDPAGAGDIIDCHFEYGTDATYGASVPCVPAAPIASPTDVSADISGLTPSTIYHFTLVVSSGSAGSVSGNDNTFQTTGPPIVQSQPATNPTENSATLNAAVDPAGFETTCVFQYVDDGSFQIDGYTGATSVPCVPASVGSVGGAFVPVSADVSGLTSSTLYHFRAVATNSAGTTNGADTTFRTAGRPVVTSEIGDERHRHHRDAERDGHPVRLRHDLPVPVRRRCRLPGQRLQHGDERGLLALRSRLELRPADHERERDRPHAGHDLSLPRRRDERGGDDERRRHDVQDPRVVPGQVGPFGSAGSTAGQFQTPIGVAVDQRGGKVYVADSANARVQKFNKKGQFKAVWGWGVKDGKAQSEVCKTKTTCQAGIVGSGAGSSPFPRASRSTAPRARRRATCTSATPATTWSRSSPPAASTCRRSTAAPPRRAISSASRAWPSTRTATCGPPTPAPATSSQFNAAGTFLGEWNDPSGLRAIAVDATHGAVYLISGNGATERFTLTGGAETTIDPGSGTALGLDPKTGNLYVDHGNDVVVYDPTGHQIDTLFSLGATTNSQGLAYTRPGSGSSAGKRDRLYVSDASTDTGDDLRPARCRGAVRHGGIDDGRGRDEEDAAGVDRPARSQHDLHLPVRRRGHLPGHRVHQRDERAVYPADLGSSFTQQQATATISGLTIGTFYHFRVVATNSAGTTTGADQTFLGGPWRLDAVHPVSGRRPGDARHRRRQPGESLRRLELDARQHQDRHVAPHDHREQQPAGRARGGPESRRLHVHRTARRIARSPIRPPSSPVESRSPRPSSPPACRQTSTCSRGSRSACRSSRCPSRSIWSARPRA